MSIRIRYFAILRERLGLEDEEIELAELGFEPTVRSVFHHCIVRREADLAKRETHLRAALNHEFVSFDAPVAEGDEIAFIPPVSGGSDPLFAIGKEPLVPQDVRNLVAHDAAGAICLFEGIVRDHTGDRDVEYLEYDAYAEMALSKLEETADAAIGKWPGIRVAIHHRYGRLEIGECAVAIAVASAHRADAFAACQWVIDTLKEEVPIWKKEVSPNGDEWVGWGP